MPDFRSLKFNPQWEPVAASTEEAVNRPRIGRMLGAPLMARVVVHQGCKNVQLQILWEFRTSEDTEADLLVMMTQGLGEEAKDVGDAVDFLWAFGYRGRKEFLESLVGSNLLDDLGWDSCLVLEPEERCFEGFRGDLWEVNFTPVEEEGLFQGIPLPLKNELDTMRDFTLEAFQAMRKRFEAEIRAELQAVEKPNIWIN